MTQSVARPRASIWFRVLAVLALLWNAIGALDYTMTNLKVEAWLAQVPPEMLAQLAAFPAWATAAWALGTWGSFAGSVLLLLRSRHALAAFLVSLVGLALTTWYEHQIGMPVFVGMNLAIWLILLALIAWSWRLRDQGMLA